MALDWTDIVVAAAQGTSLYTRPFNILIFFSSKIEKKIYEKKNIFPSFAQNIDCGYTLEPPCRLAGGSNEYPQTMLWSKNKKNRFTPVYPSCCFLYKSGVYIAQTCFPDGSLCILTNTPKYRSFSLE